MAFGEKPFGLRQVVVADEDGENGVTLPSGRTLTFGEVMASTTFEAEGRMVASSSRMTHVEWELEAGGISLAAWAMLTGRSAALTGTTPNQATTLVGSAAAMPWVQIYGRSRGDDDGDVHVRLLRCQVTEMRGGMQRGEFWVSRCRGVAIDGGSGVYEVVQHETGVSL